MTDEHKGERYEAAFFLQSGLESKGIFHDLNAAHSWLRWRSEQISTKQKAWVIYDLQNDRKRVLVNDPDFVLAGKSY